ncbi:MAG TPA: DNA repair protein RadA, partial [Gemmatimonadota bacterium]|nr:DNA repair protein RadA [Gemmatimonadota bacterium]
MTARPRTRFTCTSCGAVAPRWAGRCPDCGEWNTLVEERVEPGGTRRAGDGAPVHRLADVDAAE